MPNIKKRKKKRRKKKRVEASTSEEEDDDDEGYDYADADAAKQRPLRRRGGHKVASGHRGLPGIVSRTEIKFVDDDVDEAKKGGGNARAG